jgi:hypothetical protein
MLLYDDKFNRYDKKTLIDIKTEQTSMVLYEMINSKTNFSKIRQSFRQYIKYFLRVR